VALVPVLAALCAVATLGVHWGWVAAGVAAGALIGLLFKALVGPCRRAVTCRRSWTWSAICPSQGSTCFVPR